MRRTAACLLLVLCGCASEGVRPSATATPPSSPRVAATVDPTPTPEPTADQSRFDISRAMSHVRELGVTIGKREAGSDGDKRAARYIASQIEQIGWTATEEKFRLPQGGESSNVIGKPPGFTESEPYVLVGGHRDSLRGPGANDNATGIGIALEIARAVTERPAPLPVLFVAFGAEERQPGPGRPHHIGSIDYVARMSDEAKQNLVVMVNIDMVGHGDVIICGTLEQGPREGTKRCVAQANELDIPARERVTPDWSDHGSFQKQGMNTAWLWTGEDPCCYHNPQDTFERVRVDDVRRSAELALAIVRSYTG